VSKTATPKIQVTKNYSLFAHSQENRPLDLRKHKLLEASMKENGFIPSYPIVCRRDAKGSLVVKDGQHRLAFARKHGLAVYWIEDNSGFDVAAVNCTQKPWQPIDYAYRYADAGSAHYKELLLFKEEHGLPITLATMLLAGHTCFSAIADKFYSGEFKVKDHTWASQVVAIYVPITRLNAKLKSKQFLNACARASRVPEFSAKRLIDNVERCRDLLVHYGSCDAYMDMLQNVYNFGRRDLVALKIEATKAMRELNPATKGKAAVA
jgi:hypothetical protein